MSKSRNPLALFENLSLKSLLTIMFFLLIGIVGLWRISQKPKQVSAEWFDESYSYRRSITLTNSGIGQTNVYITLSGLDTSDTSRFQADAGDIRFTDNSGSLLNYYIVSGAGTSNTIIHVNFDNLLVGKSTIYLYYGNPSAQNGFSASDFTTAASDLSIDSPASEQVSPAPIAYWKFDEGVGTTAHDSSTNANHAVFGTGNSAPTWISSDQCLSDKCLHFKGLSGSNDGLNVNSTIMLPGQFTIQVWFKRLSGGNQYQTFLGHSDRAKIILNYNQIFVRLVGAESSVSFDFGYTNDLDNKWNLLTVIRDENNIIKAAINGSPLVSSTALTGTATYSKIGTNVDSSQVFKGYLDEVKIYPYARSASQILSDYNSGLAGQSSSDGSAVAIGGDNTGQSLSNGLVGWWKMDENTGTTTADSSGNNLTGTLTNSPTWGTGKYGVGITFNGTDQNINIGNSAIVQLTSGTISAWIKTSDAGSSYRGIVAKQYAYGIFLQNNTFAVYDWSTSRTISVGSSLNDNTWHFLTMSFQSGVTNGTKMYLDGQLVKTDTITISNQTSNLYIGYGNAPTQYFKGSIDEVRIYNRALSPSEVTALYQFTPGPIRYYNLDEGNGSTTADKSGIGPDATLISSPLWTTAKYGKGLKLNGTNSYLDLPDNPLANLRSFTVSMWANGFNDTTERALFATDGGGPYWRTTNGSNLLLWILNSSCSSGNSINTSDIASPGWHYYTFSVQDNGNVKVYRDGVQFNSYNMSGWDYVCPTSTNWSRIGKYSTSFNFDGYIDEFKIYNYARTPQQIIQDMNAGNPMSSKSMIAYYKFDEGYGSIANNSGSIGSTANGTLASSTSSPTWTTNGKFNKALSFDGGDYVTFGTTNDFNFGTNSFAFSLWAKFGSTRVVMPISKNTAGYTEPGYRLYINSTDRMELSVTDGTNSCGYYSPAITNYLNKWTHYTGVWNSENKTCSLYADGTFLGSGTNNSLTSTSNTTRSLTLGRNAGGGYGFQGQIDEVKIYNYALTADEIKKDYNQGSTFVFGSTSQTIGATTTSLDYCLPGDTSYCAAPVAEWKMDEGVGTTAYNTASSTQVAFGPGSSAPSWNTGKIGKSLLFSGNDYMSIANSSFSYTGLVTLNAWIKTSSSTAGGIIGRYGNSSRWTYRLFMDSSGQINFNRGRTAGSGGDYNTTLTTSKSINDGNWHYITASFDNLAMKIYIDGIENVSVGQTNPSEPSLGNFCIGTDYYNCLVVGTGYFNGYIDQVRIYDYARTRSQIAYDYNRGAPIAHYKLDECQGTVAHDASGNNFHGTINADTIGTCTSSGAWYDGRNGKLDASLYLDGDTDHIAVGNIGTSTTTLSFWIKPDSTTQSIIELSSGDTVALSSGIVSVTGFGTETVYVDGRLSSTVSDTNWHHITIASSADIPANTVNIGKISSSYYSGQIDDVRIYNYALTSTQIKTLFNDGAINFSN